jgi:M6 family metalloprotease-like protein
VRGLAAAAALVCACLVGVLASAPGGRAATCTAEEKTARVQALARFQQTAAAARRAYFRRHKSARQRKAFVQAQQRKLRALRAAAACTVPPLPPSSSLSCSFMLAPNEENLRIGRTERGPVYNEGPLDPSGVVPPIGRVAAVMLFVDFADAPGGAEPTTSVAPLFTAETRYFEEVSFGRFGLSITPVDRWIRMPQPASFYNPISLVQHRYVREAILAADPFVDFSPFSVVFIVPSRGAIIGNRPHTLYPGFGVRVDGTELRFAALFDPGIRMFGRNASFVLNHEFAHTFGLPDMRAGVIGFDPMGPSSGQPWPSGAHMLGWHKWKLGWLDPPQLTCLEAAGQLEETLTPIAAAGGKKLVVVPIAPSLAYAVEARRRIGYDAHACEEGVLVYAVDSQASVSAGQPIELKGTPACGNASPGAFAVGEAFEDAAVKVEVLATDGRDYRVRVTKKR